MRTVLNTSTLFNFKENEFLCFAFLMAKLVVWSLIIGLSPIINFDLPLPIQFRTYADFWQLFFEFCDDLDTNCFSDVLVNF